MKMENKLGSTLSLTRKDIRNIFIGQERPSNEKSPYFDLEKKYNLDIEFEPLTQVDPVSAKDFRKQKIDIINYTAVIFKSRNAIDHFFRICEEMRINVSQDMKYFCITEAIALYLQKFILYRKRKVFYGDDGSNESLFETIKKYKEQEKFLYPCSESYDSQITNWLTKHKVDYATPVLYEVKASDVRNLLQEKKFQIVSIFTPLSVESYIKNSAGLKNDKTIIATFGVSTEKAVREANLEPGIVVPNKETRSMAEAIDLFISNLPER